jgi:thiamine pyrophosphokinase
MQCVIFAGGELRPGRAVQEALARADLVIAADSGAATALRLGYVPQLVVGDFDSLDPETARRLHHEGSFFVRAAVEKDETDSELALQQAQQRGASEITLLGGLGGARFDHALANILLLAGYETVPLRIIDGPSTCWLLRGPGSSAIRGRPGDLLSLFPLGAAATGIRTANLSYPLNGEALHLGKPRGVSNALTAVDAEVSLEAGLLLIVHTDIHELESPPTG